VKSAVVRTDANGMLYYFDSSVVNTTHLPPNSAKSYPRVREHPQDY